MNAAPLHLSMNRRRFLTGMAGILAAGYSASVLPSGVIMPIRKLWVPDIDRTVTVAASAIWNYDEILFTKMSMKDGVVLLDGVRFIERSPLAPVIERD